MSRRRVVEPLGSRGKVSLTDIFGEERTVKPTVDSMVKRRVKTQEKKKRVVIRMKREY